jgi:HEAT repeat protein
MSKKYPPVKADDQMRELEQGPGFLARRAELDRAIEARRETMHDASKPVLADLGQVGVRLASLGEPISDKDRPAALRVFMRWLPLVTNRDVKEVLVRGLSVPAAGKAGARCLIDALVREGTDGRDESLMWAMGNGLEVLSKFAPLEELIQLAESSPLGEARQMVVLALAKHRDPSVVPVLVRLLDDETVCGHAVAALAKLKVPSTRSHLESFVSHRKPWIRNEAKKGLRGIQKIIGPTH